MSILYLQNPASEFLQTGHKFPDIVSIFFFFFFWRCRVSIVKFSYWLKFHVNIITVSGVMTIFVYKGLTRSLEIKNIPVWVFPNIWMLGWAKDTKFGPNLALMKSYSTLPNAKAKTFTVSELLRGNQQVDKKTPNQISVNSRK